MRDADVEDLEADERVAAGAGKGHVHARRGPASAEEEDELVYDSEREEVLEKRAPAPDPADDSDENVGSDFDADGLPPPSDPGPPPPSAADARLTVPNAVFLPARIMVNPRCVTTYAGVSHTQLALDLFGPPDREGRDGVAREMDMLEEWEGAPDAFVCQEQQ